jgi:hypothetical protein
LAYAQDGVSIRWDRRDSLMRSRVAWSRWLIVAPIAPGSRRRMVGLLKRFTDLSTLRASRAPVKPSTGANAILARFAMRY